ncbi:MAG: hypothetical protein JXK07_15845 [Spirochaetes bacterium]|nr:hypothetical protein [Spirochaetota bacterium]MBN2770750.1 hypothetical protein [Spirochaetota bacterium]
MQPSSKLIESETVSEYRNKETSNRDRIEYLFFENFNLFLRKSDLISANPAMKLYNSRLFVFGGYPAQAVSIYLDPMLRAWHKGQFTENCDCGKTGYIYSCGGSLMSGTVGWRYSYCPDCKKYYNRKKPGSVGLYFHLADKIMRGCHNIKKTKHLVEIPLEYRYGKVIEHNLKASHSEVIMNEPVQTLTMENIVKILKKVN